MSVVTIGNFDGVHLGHKTILATALTKAQRTGLKMIVFTFRPHPQLALHPGKHIPLLSSYDEKVRLLYKEGAQQVIEEPFSREFSTLTPEEFFNKTLMERLHASHIVVGHDFAFGKERTGHLDVLAKLCEKNGVSLEIVPPFQRDGETVSSTAIRKHLQAREIRAANRLLGHEFRYHGIVMKGAGRGRTIGFPTANLRPEDGKLILPYGVYATRTQLNEGADLPSVTNIGIRPTFESHEPEILIETHLLDLSKDLYGSDVDVKFFDFIRPEQKFEGPQALKNQIEQDLQAARLILLG